MRVVGLAHEDRPIMGVYPCGRIRVHSTVFILGMSKVTLHMENIDSPRKPFVKALICVYMYVHARPRVYVCS